MLLVVGTSCKIIVTMKSSVVLGGRRHVVTGLQGLQPGVELRGGGIGGQTDEEGCSGRRGKKRVVNVRGVRMEKRQRCRLLLLLLVVGRL
jgi:hypothetical protein